MPKDPYLIRGEQFYKIRLHLRYLETLIAGGVFVSFFAPWIKSPLDSTSLYEFLSLQKGFSVDLLLLAIPLFSWITIFLVNHRVKSWLSLLFGVLMLSLLWFFQTIKIFQLENLLWGGYMATFLLLFLVILSSYKIFNKETLLHKKKIAINSRVLKPWLAFAMLLSFSFPYFYLDGVYRSAYALLLERKYSVEYWSLGAVFISALLLMLFYKLNMKIKLLSFLTAILVYLLFFRMIFIFGKEVISIFSIGFYFSLFLGSWLLFLSLRSVLSNHRN